jgi:hypothetical protein
MGGRCSIPGYAITMLDFKEKRNSYHNGRLGNIEKNKIMITGQSASKIYEIYFIF